MMDSVVERYIQLVQRFVGGKLDAEQFADQAVDFWHQNYDHLFESSPENRIIGDLCLEADALSNEPPYNSTPEELLDMAREVLDELLELQKERHP